MHREALSSEQIKVLETQLDKDQDGTTVGAKTLMRTSLLTGKWTRKEQVQQLTQSSWEAKIC